MLVLALSGLIHSKKPIALSSAIVPGEKGPCIFSPGDGETDEDILGLKLGDKLSEIDGLRLGLSDWLGLKEELIEVEILDDIEGEIEGEFEPVSV